jgi:hypothetical protein
MSTRCLNDVLVDIFVYSRSGTKFFYLAYSTNAYCPIPNAFYI